VEDQKDHSKKNLVWMGDKTNRS